MKASNMNKIGLCLLFVNVLSISTAFAQATPKLDFSGGNGGAEVGPTVYIPVAGPIDLTLGAYGGADLVDGKEVSLHGKGEAGIALNFGEILRLNPILAYKCETIVTDASQSAKDKTNGCDPRAGLKLFVGDKTDFNLGVGVTKALGDKKHGENLEFQFLLTVPLSANDEERHQNSKGDMDFDSKPKVQESTRAVSV